MKAKKSRAKGAKITEKKIKKIDSLKKISSLESVRIMSIPPEARKKFEILLDGEKELQAADPKKENKTFISEAFSLKKLMSKLKMFGMKK